MFSNQISTVVLHSTFKSQSKLCIIRWKRQHPISFNRFKHLMKSLNKLGRDK